MTGIPSALLRGETVAHTEFTADIPIDGSSFFARSTIPQTGGELFVSSFAGGF